MTPLRHIKAATASVYGIKASDLTGPSRRRVFTYPRQLAMFIARKDTEHSTPEIGRAFGGRDHTTVLHAVNSVKQRMNEEIRGDIARIEACAAIIAEREAGGVFRSVRADPDFVFKSVRSKT